MQSVDLRGEFNDIFFEPERKISQVHLDTVCKFGHKSETCRYIGLGPNGFVCAKHTRLKPVLDERVKKELMIARGDNCDGFGSIDLEVKGAEKEDKEKNSNSQKKDQE